MKSSTLLVDNVSKSSPVDASTAQLPALPIVASNKPILESSKGSLLVDDDKKSRRSLLLTPRRHDVASKEKTSLPDVLLKDDDANKESTSAIALPSNDELVIETAIPLATNNRARGLLRALSIWASSLILIWMN